MILLYCINLSFINVIIPLSLVDVSFILRIPLSLYWSLICETLMLNCQINFYSKFNKKNGIPVYCFVLDSPTSLNVKIFSYHILLFKVNEYQKHDLSFLSFKWFHFFLQFIKITTIVFKPKNLPDSCLQQGSTKYSLSPNLKSKSSLNN